MSIKHTPEQSLIETLERFVANEALWRSIEPLDVPTERVIDLILMDLARSELGTIKAALLCLRDPRVWKRLQDAAAAAFPNDPGRRLPPTPPTRHRYDLARRCVTAETLDELQRGSRREIIEVAQSFRLLDPGR